MPDEPLAPAPADTPAVTPADSPEGTPAPENYEDRYKEVQAAFTRSQQENSQLRQFVDSFSDPEKAAEALSALGYEIAQEEQEPPQYDNPYEQELAEVRAQLAEQGKTLSEMTQAQQQAAQQAAEQAYFTDQLESLDLPEGSLTQQDVTDLVALAKAVPDAEGKPDVKGAWTRLQAHVDRGFEERVKGKKRAPKPPSGQPGAAVPDMSTREGRLHAAQERLAALEQ